MILAAEGCGIYRVRVELIVRLDAASPEAAERMVARHAQAAAGGIVSALSAAGVMSSAGVESTAHLGPDALQEGRYR